MMYIPCSRSHFALEQGRPTSTARYVTPARIAIRGVAARAASCSLAPRPTLTAAAVEVERLAFGFVRRVNRPNR